MVDWLGHSGASTADRYRFMAESQLRDSSPSYARLCLGVADDPDLLGLLDTLPAPKRQPNLLLAAVRFLSGGGPVQSYAAFRAFVLGCWDELADTMRTRRTQTNEVRRCATLLPALPLGPLALIEVGASAGLCLYPDRYAYRYDGRDVLGDSELVLDCRTSGPVPVPRTLPDVVWRAGLDLNPLDVRNGEDVRWLESLIWPEHTDRFAALRVAVGIAAEEPAPITRGSLITDLPALVAQAPAEATLVVFHSAVLAYLTAVEREAFVASLAELARSRPNLVWLSNEGPGIVVDGPADGPAHFVVARDGVALATAAPHGQRLDWLSLGRSWEECGQDDPV